MKLRTKYRKLPTRFGPETGFELEVRPPAPFRAAHERKFEGLKEQLLEERLDETFGEGLGEELRRAANEAAALAWVTAYPLLVFPALFEEKADAVTVRAERQHLIRQRSRELLAL
jgi:hypothetical protein